MSTEKTHRLVGVCLPYLALVLLHTILGSRMQRPFVFSDEISYLGTARYLAGAAHMPDLTGMMYHHFGYSLFLLPAFWWFADPIHSYMAVIIINGALISSLYFSLYYVFHTLFEHPRKISAIVSLVACLYPAFVLDSNVAMAENAFIPFFALMIASFGAFLNQKSYWTATLFGFATGSLYAIHPRALPIIPTALIYLSFLTWSKYLPRPKALTSIALIGSIFWGTRSLISHLKAIGWGGRGLVPLGALASEVFSTDGLKEVALEASGQLLYLSLATYGLFLLGVMYIGAVLWKRKSPVPSQTMYDEKIHTLAFLLLTSLEVVFGSSFILVNAGLTHQQVTSDLFIYGRYNEGFLAFFVGFALIGLHSEAPHRPRSSNRALVVIVIIGLLTLCVLVGRDHEALSAPVAGVHSVLGIFPAVQTLGRLDLGFISCTAIVLFILITTAVDKGFRAGIAVLLVAFLSVVAFDYKYYLDSQAKMIQVTTLVPHIRALGTIKTVSYDMTYFNPHSFFGYQFLLPDIVFKRFWSDRGEIPASSIVISGRNWRDANTLSARILAVEHGVDNVLWVSRGGVRRALPGDLFQNR